MPQNLRVAIYCRISRDPSGQAGGVQRQERICRDLAKGRGFEVVEVLTENDTSAFSGVDRPQYNRLLALLAAGDIDGVVTYNLDRLTRSVRQLADLLDHGVPIFTSVVGDLDPRSPFGKALAMIVGVLAEMESSIKQERIRDKHAELASVGAWASGRSFGYTKDGVVIDAEAEVIKEVADRLLRGQSLRSVTAWLGESEVPTVKGGSWRGSTVKQMITAARLSGQREWTPRSKGRGYGMGEIIGDGAWDPILSKEQTAALRAIFSKPREVGRPVERLLSGALSYCGLCGKPLQAAKDNRQGRRYACIKSPGTGRCGGISVSAEPLEEYVVAAVGLMLEGEALPAPPTPNAAPLIAQRDALIADLGTLAADWGSGLISRSEYLAARSPLTERLSSAERALVDAMAAPVLAGLPDTSERLAAEWPEMSMEQRRLVLIALLDGVIVQPARMRGRPHFDRDRVRLVWAGRERDERAQVPQP